MATNPAATDVALEEIAPAQPVIGKLVALALYDGNHKLHALVGHILAVNGTGTEAQLSVAYPAPNPDPRVLSGPGWHAAYVRRTGVRHFSDPEVQAGRESICWSTTVLPTIPQPKGDPAERFARQPLPEAERVSPRQAAAVQTGKAPGPTTQSPLLNESEASQEATPVGGVPGGATVPQADGA